MTALSWSPVGEDRAVVRSDTGRELAVYSWSTAKNHPYFRDVRPTGHDGVLTATAPWDHRWHHGLWWSWKFIDDVLYWEDHPDYGNGRGRGLGRSSVVVHDVRQDDGRIHVTEDLRWRPDGSEESVLDERRAMVLHADVDAPGAWAIDWSHTWTARSRAVLSATTYPEHWWGGYGGLNIRAARAMAAGETILASGGLTGRDAVHGQPVEWMALGGNVDGSGADEPDHPATGGFAIFPDPDLGGPTPAYVFSAHDEFGFLAAAPVMHEDLVVEAGEELRLGYRTVLLGSTPDAERMERLHAEYVISVRQSRASTA